MPMTKVDGRIIPGLTYDWPDRLFLFCISFTADGPQRARLPIPPTATSILPVVTKDLSTLRFSRYDFLSRCCQLFSTLITRQPMVIVEFYLLAFSHFRYRRKNTNSGFHKNRTHDFRTSRCTWLPSRPLATLDSHCTLDTATVES